MFQYTYARYLIVPTLWLPHCAYYRSRYHSCLEYVNRYEAKQRVVFVACVSYHFIKTFEMFSLWIKQQHIRLVFCVTPSFKFMTTMDAVHNSLNSSDYHSRNC